MPHTRTVRRPSQAALAVAATSRLSFSPRTQPLHPSHCSPRLLCHCPTLQLRFCGAHRRHELQNHHPVRLPMAPAPPAHSSPKTLLTRTVASTGAPSSSLSTGPSTAISGVARPCTSAASLRPRSTLPSRDGSEYEGSPSVHAKLR